MQNYDHIYDTWERASCVLTTVYMLVLQSAYCRVPVLNLTHLLKKERKRDAKNSFILEKHCRSSEKKQFDIKLETEKKDNQSITKRRKQVEDKDLSAQDE